MNFFHEELVLRENLRTFRIHSFFLSSLYVKYIRRENEILRISRTIRFFAKPKRRNIFIFNRKTRFRLNICMFSFRKLLDLDMLLQGHIKTVHISTTFRLLAKLKRRNILDIQ